MSTTERGELPPPPHSDPPLLASMLTERALFCLDALCAEAARNTGVPCGRLEMLEVCIRWQFQSQYGGTYHRRRKGGAT